MNRELLFYQSGENVTPQQISAAFFAYQAQYTSISVMTDTQGCPQCFQYSDEKCSCSHSVLQVK